MQELSDNSKEFAILEFLINEQNRYTDQNTLHINVVSEINNYVQSEAAIFIIFDFENPELATKKLIAGSKTWDAENTFPISQSPICKLITELTTLTEYSFRPYSEIDPLVFETIIIPIKNIILAPLSVNNKKLGGIIFINPVLDLKQTQRKKFLELVVMHFSNSIHSMEHNRQLIVSNADLEASQWEILNSRNTLRTFFDNIPTCVYIIDRSYTIMAINSRRSERVDKSPHQLVGGKCYARLFSRSSPCAACEVQDAFKGVPAVRNLREWGPKETFVHWEITTIPIREHSNEIHQAIIFDEDVTEKWILEANMIQSEKLASIGQLAANVAHEINNPLAAIIANAQLLLRDLEDADENTLEALKLIETAGVRAAKIVGDLLDSARLEKRDEFEEVSLNETIQSAVSMVSYEIKNRSASIELDLDENIPQIYANQNQLKGVWINLVINALGAIEKPNGHISISTRYENFEYRIVFSDNGKGILPEHQNRIFEPFFTTKEAGKGTGLGLSVSLQVIKDHHGNILFETTPGEGTKFFVTLPTSGQNTP